MGIIDRIFSKLILISVIIRPLCLALIDLSLSITIESLGEKVVLSLRFSEDKSPGDRNILPLLITTGVQLYSPS